LYRDQPSASRRASDVLDLSVFFKVARIIPPDIADVPLGKSEIRTNLVVKLYLETDNIAVRRGFGYGFDHFSGIAKSLPKPRVLPVQIIQV
jgi:hypothetical protein